MEREIKMKGLTGGRGQDSSGRAAPEAAAVDYGSAACSRENTPLALYD